MKLKSNGFIIDGNDDNEELSHEQMLNSLLNKENENSASPISNVPEPTELGDALRELNNDNIDDSSKMSNIDMRANLLSSEISAILEIDTLVSFNFLPQSCLSFTRQKKRLSVSQRGKGRSDIVNIISGKNDVDAKKGTGGLFNNIGNVMGGNK